MSWVETPSLFFSARHESSQTAEARALLWSLEEARESFGVLFPRVPEKVGVVIHDSPIWLALAHPHLPVLQRATAPAGRRYLAGWFKHGEIHTLSQDALRDRAVGPDSWEALRRTPLRQYASLVVGENSRRLPPPFGAGAFNRYLQWAWLAEGAAQYFSGQVPYLRTAIGHRRRSRKPDFPPGLRDAALLGGTIYDLLERERGQPACVALALSSLNDTPAEAVLAEAFARDPSEIEALWRDRLEELARPEPGSELRRDLERSVAPSAPG